MAQSLEELSTIYSEANELGLTSLGVTQPHSLQSGEQMMLMVEQQVHTTTCTAEAAGGSRAVVSLQQPQQHGEEGSSGLQDGSGEVEREEMVVEEERELDYESDQVSTVISQQATRTAAS